MVWHIKLDNKKHFDVAVQVRPTSTMCHRGGQDHSLDERKPNNDGDDDDDSKYPNQDDDDDAHNANDDVDANNNGALHGYLLFMRFR